MGKLFLRKVKFYVRNVTERLAVYRQIQEQDFPDPQHLSYEQRLLYLPLLRGVMYETENLAWCDTAIDFLSEREQHSSSDQ